LDLLKNLTTDGPWPLQGEAYSSLFARYIKFAVEDEEVPVEYVELCVNYFNSLQEPMINDLCAASIRYCNAFLEATGQEKRIFKNLRDVLSFIYPSTLIVPGPLNGMEPVLHMELNCDWEPEHGMEWIVRGNQVLYVGAFNGEDPWRDYLKKETWNYA
jgi:hypothetical protein